MSTFPASESAGPPASGQLPRVFGRYVLFDQIGRGGMADIYLARADTELGGSRLVVVKQILPELTRDAAFERMFITEAKLAATLHNTNIVQVFDLGREGERLFIGMEYVEGYDMLQLLRQLSRARVALPAEFALFIVREVLGALSYAHRARRGEAGSVGVVHRDVSPSNVLISFEGEVKLCDFGIARALTQRDEPTGEPGAAPRMAGKSAYMAPEQARGDELDARADVFAAGILLWELCAGRRLYKGTETEMLELARAAEVPPLPNRGLPAHGRLQSLLSRALARDPAGRFQSAADMQRALDAYAAEAQLHASQLRFGAFLTEQFGAQIIETRRDHERAARSLSSMLPPSMSEQGEGLPPLSAPSRLPSIGNAPGGAAEAPPASGWLEPGNIAQPPLRPGGGGGVEVVEPGAVPAEPGPPARLSDEADSQLRALMERDVPRTNPADETLFDPAQRRGQRGMLLVALVGLSLLVGLAVYLWS